MANSKHLAIRNRAVTILEPVAAGLVKAGRAWAMASQNNKLVKVYLDTAVPERAQFGGQPDDWQTRIRIELHARGTSLLAGEDIADAMVTAAYALLQTDPSLGIDCIDCIPVGMAWTTDEADTSIAVCQLVLEVKHRTPYNSIAA